MKRSLVIILAVLAATAIVFGTLMACSVGRRAESMYSGAVLVSADTVNRDAA